MSKYYVALVSIEHAQGGTRGEILPGHVITGLSQKQLDGLEANGHAREATEAEEALYERQNPKSKDKGADEAVTQQRAVPQARGTATKAVKEPAAANGPGGATEEDEDGDKGGSSVASDTDSIAAAKAAAEVAEGAAGKGKGKGKSRADASDLA